MNFLLNHNENTLKKNNSVTLLKNGKQKKN